VKLEFAGWRSFPVVLAQNGPALAYVLPPAASRAPPSRSSRGTVPANVSAVYVSGSGVQATLSEYARPMNAMQATELRDRMQELQKQPLD